MSAFDVRELDYPLTVTVLRPSGGVTEAGDWDGAFETVAEHLPADIQLSLQIRSYVSEDRTGITDNAVWTMFAVPPAPIRENDRVTDGDRTFVVDAVGDWGTHVECLMRRLT